MNRIAVGNAHDAIGKFKCLHIIARKRNLGNDFANGLWDEVGRLQVWLADLERGSRERHLPTNSTETVEVLLKDLHMTLDGAIGIACVQNGTSGIDTSVSEDNDGPASLDDLLQDLSDVVSDISKTNLILHYSPLNHGPSSRVPEITVGRASKIDSFTPSVVTSDLTTGDHGSDVFSANSDDEGTMASTMPSTNAQSGIASRLGVPRGMRSRTDKARDLSEKARAAGSFIVDRPRERNNVAASRPLAAEPLSSRLPEHFTHDDHDRVRNFRLHSEHDKGWKLEIKRWKRVNNRYGFSEIYDESQKIEDIRKKEQEIRSGGFVLSIYDEYDVDGKLKKTLLQIHSPPLLDLLRAVITFYPGGK